MPILGTPTAVTGGGSYTAETGTNRIVVITLARRTTDTGTNLNPAVSTLSWGSASLAGGQIVLAKDASVGLGTNTRASIWYIKEADIPSGSQTAAATWSQAMNGSDLFMFFTLGSINQTTPVDGTGAAETHSSSVSSFAGTLTVAANCIQILNFGVGGSGTAITPGWTEVQAAGNGNHKCETQYTTGQSAGSVGYSAAVSPNSIGALAVASFAEIVASSWTQYRQHPAQRSALLRM